MRDYAKEYEWHKKKYDRINVYLEKNLMEKFRNKLKNENKTISGWITEKIQKYTKN